VENGEFTEARAGRVLRHKSAHHAR
jgi:hypothetical protein